MFTKTKNNKSIDMVKNLNLYKNEVDGDKTLYAYARTRLTAKKIMEDQNNIKIKYKNVVKVQK